MRVLSKIYHDYGLKHILLITVLVLYQFIGAAIFFLCEASYDENREKYWINAVKTNRSRLIQLIISSMFNNTEYLFFLTANQTTQVIFFFFTARWWMISAIPRSHFAAHLSVSVLQSSWAVGCLHALKEGNECFTFFFFCILNFVSLNCYPSFFNSVSFSFFCSADLQPFSPWKA